MRKIGFVIINYNDFKTTMKLIDNIKNYKIIDEIVVVDNKSTDDSISNLEKIKEITLIKNDKNYGFAKAINIGCKYLINKYKELYIIVSNSDIRITEENDIKELISSFKIKDVAVVAPVIIEPNGIERGWKILSVSKDLLINIPLINRLYRNRLLKYDDSYYNTHVSYVDMVKGCFFIIDSTVLANIDYLDENTFLYYEENILAKKLLLKNAKTVVNNKVNIYHDHSVTISKNVNNINKYKIVKQSMMYYEKEYNNANGFELMLFRVLNNINLLVKKIRRR